MAAILKIYFELLNRKVCLLRECLGDLQIKNCWNRSGRKSKMVTMADILKIYFALLLLNGKAYWLETWLEVSEQLTPSYGFYISKLIWFARMSRHLADFKARNKTLTAKLLSLSELQFYGDLVYKFREKKIGKPEFSDHFSKIANCYKRKGRNIDVINQSACLADNPITVDHFAYLINYTPVYSGFRHYDDPELKTIHYMVWTGTFSCLLLGSPGFSWWSSFAPVFQGCVWQPTDLQVSQNVVSFGFSSLLHYRLYLWFICCPQWYMGELEDLHTDQTNICFIPMEAEGEGWG